MTAGSSWLRARSLALGFTALAALASACGGDDGGYSGGTANPSPITCAAGTSVDIGASGASPGCLQVDPGTTVTFTNGRTTEMESAPPRTRRTAAAPSSTRRRQSRRAGAST